MYKFQKAFSMVIITLGIIAIGLMFVQGDILTPSFVIGGVILNGLLGGFRGKVGPVVGGKWKDIDTMRAYAVPNDPQSANQVIQRSRMSAAVAIARQILGDILQPYWDPFYTKMSGFNAWVKENIMSLAASTYNLGVSNIMFKGSVLSLPSITATYNTATGAVAITWTNNSNGSTGLDSDTILLVIASITGTVYFAGLTSAERQEESTTKTIITGLTATNLIVYLGFTRGTGATLAVSDSVADICAAI